MEIDYSELEGRMFRCMDECGFCCLCQPEVLHDERSFFMKNHPTALVHNKYPDEHYALALKKGQGSCVFLNGRRCSVYERRPTYCRQFPYHFHVSDRVKIELDLSCRGVWAQGGTDAVSDVQDIVRKADRRLMDAFREASAVYQEFYGNCKEAGVMGNVTEIRRQVSDAILKFTDPAFLGNVMEASVEEPVMTIPSMTMKNMDMGEVEEAARDAALGSMESEDPVSVPIYCNDRFEWNVFMASGNRIEWKMLDDDGDIIDKVKANVNEIPLMPLDDGGRKTLADYIRILNGRDSILGNVYYMMDSLGYEDDMANTYFGGMSVSVLDLMWRASMLNHFTNISNGIINEAVMKEAIIFYDMDRLDAPTIGAFV